MDVSAAIIAPPHSRFTDDAYIESIGSPCNVRVGDGVRVGTITSVVVSPDGQRVDFTVYVMTADECDDFLRSLEGGTEGLST